MANVVPIYKKGCISQTNNYRPVSLLSVVSKCLEECIHKKIYLFGFRKGHPPQFNFYDKVYNHLAGCSFCDVIYLDLLTVPLRVSPHPLLIHKLCMYGFRGNLLSSFAKYMLDRQQGVVYEGVASVLSLSLF